MDHNVSGFSAKHMRRPGQEALLTVSGDCKVPATVRAVLEQAEKQDENDPTHLLLDLIIHVPSGLPPTFQENKATMNIDFKLATEDNIEKVTITDVHAEEGTEEQTVWEVPVKQINLGNYRNRSRVEAVEDLVGRRTPAELIQAEPVRSSE